MGNLELGRFGKKGSVDVNAFKENVKKEQIKDAKMQQIYDAIDSNKDGVIDKKELENFQKSIFTAAGNDRLSKREAKSLLKDMNLRGLKGNDLLNFLNTLSQLPEEAEQVPQQTEPAVVERKPVETPVNNKPLEQKPVEEAVQEENPDKYGKTKTDRKSTRLNSSHTLASRMPSSA